MYSMSSYFFLRCTTEKQTGNNLVYYWSLYVFVMLIYTAAKKKIKNWDLVLILHVRLAFYIETYQLTCKKYLYKYYKNSGHTKDWKPLAKPTFIVLQWRLDFITKWSTSGRFMLLSIFPPSSNRTWYPKAIKKAFFFFHNVTPFL